MVEAFYDDETETVSPLDERYPRWQPSGGGNGVMRAVFGLLYEHGPMTRDELVSELAATLSGPSLAYVRRCYLHSLRRNRLHSVSRPRSGDSVPPRDPIRELRTYVNRNLQNALRRKTVAHDGGTVDTRRWRTTSNPPRFTVDPNEPPVKYTAERHAEWVARERAVTDESVASMDIQIYATGQDELEMWARLAAFAAAERDELAGDDYDGRRFGMSQVVQRFRRRPAANRRAVIAALAAELARLPVALGGPPGPERCDGERQEQHEHDQQHGRQS
jgi:hypothetical protein